jgi:hypothetical protein
LSGDDTLVYYGGGSYALEGNIYTESIKYNILKSRVGRTIPFEVEVSNDTLIQKGLRRLPLMHPASGSCTRFGQK